MLAVALVREGKVSTRSLGHAGAVSTLTFYRRMTGLAFAKCTAIITVFGLRASAAGVLAYVF